MKKVITRSAIFNDEAQVNNLCRRNGLAGEGCDQAWHWIWKNNKFYSSKWIIGWVLEFDKEIVGYIGNIPRQYTFNNKNWTAGVARSFVVDKEYRKHSLKLISRFFQQKEADLFIFSSANDLSSSVYKIAKAKPIPQDNYNNDLFWIVTPFSFTLSFLRKKNFPKVFVFLSAILIYPFILLESLIRNRWQENSNCTIEIVNPKLLTNNFDEFWHNIKNSNLSKMLSIRDREAILWQYDNCSSKNRKPVFFILSIGEKIYGYMIISHIISKEFKAKRIIIDDLIVCDDDPSFIRCLTREAFLYAKANKIDLLQVTGLTDEVRNSLSMEKPFSRKYSYSRFWYFAVNHDLKQPLKEKTTWCASMFDGDSTI